MASKTKTEKAMWVSLLDLSLVIIGYLATLPTAFLIAFAILLFFVVSSSFGSPEFSKLSFKRRLSTDRISDRDEIAVDEYVGNNGRSSVFIEVLSRVPEEVAISEGSNHYVAYLKSSEVKRVRYKIKPSFTGNFTFKKVSIRTLNQLVAPYEETERDIPTAFSVYPVLEEVRKFPFARMSVKPTQGVIRSRTPGRGTEFFEIRDYAVGDDFRRINWKASARSGTLLSNEYDSERMADIYMVLDSTSSTSYFLKDYIRIFVSLVDFFLRMGNRVGLIVIGKFWNWVMSGSGRKQLVRLVDNIIEERSGDPLTLSYHVENTMRVVSQTSTVILLSPLRDGRIRDLVKRMVERRQKIMPVIPGSATVDPEAKGLDRSWVGVAKKLAELKRGEAQIFLKKIGLPAIEWDPNSPIAETVEMLQRWAGRELMTTA